MRTAIPLPADAIAALCRKWRIKELAVFGSVPQDDFGPDSDVDILVGFMPDEHWSLMDIVRLEDDFT